MDTLITKTIQDIVTHLALEVKDIKVFFDEELETKVFVVETNDPHLLIGKNGDILQALNHIVRRIFEENSESGDAESKNFLIDVNGYYKRKLEDIKTKARIVTERARSFKSDIPLEPMSAYDRRVVHAYVSQFSDVRTESQGEGRDRHIVIKYIG
jgi:spoIIIJ-associated protein